MPKTLFNIDHQPARLIEPLCVVLPGDSHEFTDEQIAVGISGQWSETDPRAGLAEEIVFKQQRDSATEAPEAPVEESEAAPVDEVDAQPNTEPAEPEEEA